MEKVDHRLREQIKRLGAFDLEACYSCGSCSAVCPLSEGEVSFPRRMIRYSLLGLDERLSSSPEPWLCYQCGECSETCPRDADPGGLMAALRRYSIRRYSAGRIADVFTSAFASWFAWIFLSLLMTALIIFFHNPGMDLEKVDFLSFMPLERIHGAGLALGAFLGAAFIANVAIMAGLIRRSLPNGRPSAKRLATSLASTFREAAVQRRFAECGEDRLRYWAHMSLFWGFAGMFAATLLVLGIDYEYIDISRTIPFLSGSVFGAVALAGASYFIWLRSRPGARRPRHSGHSDWIFLCLIMASVLSGFVMDLFKVLDQPRAAYISFAVHMIAVFDLLVSLPFTKFAHAVYRPVALWMSGAK